MRLTRPVRSILDAAEHGTSPEQIVMAIWQAVERGLLLPGALRSKVRGYSGRVERLVSTALDGR